MALFLDLDNTVLPSRLVYESTIQALAKDWEEKGYGSQTFFFENYEKARKITKDLLVGHSSNRLRILYFKNLIEAWKGELSVSHFELVFWLEGRYNFHFSYFLQEEKSNQPKWKDLFDLLLEVQTKTTICFVTNENLRTQGLKIRSFLPPELKFQFVCSEEVGLEKPSTKFFEYALSKVNESPKRSLIIGDNLDDDIEGGARMGIPSIHITEIFGSSGKVNSLPSRHGTEVFQTDQTISAINFALARLSQS